MLSQAIEDYLKAIYELHQSQATVTTSRLAERLAVTPASATGMVKKLAELKLVEHAPYRGVHLTRAGERIALEVVRHHRLVERYLAEALGVPWDRVHEEAERWEHVLSEEVEERMDALLGRPVTDPHGAPIPARDGTLPRRARLRLSEVEPPCRVTIAEVEDDDPALLRYLGRQGLYPEVELRLTERAPFAGPLTLERGAERLVLGAEVAERVWVHPPQPLEAV